MCIIWRTAFVWRGAVNVRTGTVTNNCDDFQQVNKNIHHRGTTAPSVKNRLAHAPSVKRLLPLLAEKIAEVVTAAAASLLEFLLLGVAGGGGSGGEEFGELGVELVRSETGLQGRRIAPGKGRLGRPLLRVLHRDFVGGGGRRLDLQLVRLEGGDFVLLADRIRPRDGDLASLVEGRLSAVRGGEVVDHEDVALLPPTEYHVLVDGGSDLRHFRDGNRLSVPEGGVEAHLVSQNGVLDDAKDGNDEELEEHPPLAGTPEGQPELGGERGPVKDLGVVEPHVLLGDRMELEGVGLGDANERLVAFRSAPLERDVLGPADLLDAGLVVRPEQFRPTEHVGDVVGVVRALLLVRASVANALVEELASELQREVLVDLSEVGDGGFASHRL